MYLAHTKLSLAFQQNDTNKTRIDSISYCVGWLKHKTLDNTKGGEECGTNKAFICYWQECEMVQPLRKSVCSFSYIYLHYEPVVSSLGIY